MTKNSLIKIGNRKYKVCMLLKPTVHEHSLKIPIKGHQFICFHYTKSFWISVWKTEACYLNTSWSIPWRPNMFFNICTRKWIIKNAIPTSELINAVKKKNNEVIKYVFSYRFSPKKISEVISSPYFEKLVEYVPKITNCMCGFKLVGLLQI